MNRAELIGRVATATGSKRKDSEAFVNAVFDCITNALVAGEKVQLVGFGTFETRHRAERIGRNPQTKEEMTIPPATVPAFKAGKALKDALSEGSKAE